MLMTREMDYALRIVRALHRGEQLSAAEIARREHMPKAITLKILKQLHAGGLVVSRRGPSGGYMLSRDCGEIYLRDVFLGLGEYFYLNRCQQPGYRCENFPEGDCGLCRELDRVQGILDGELARTPLGAIFQET